MKQNKIAKAMMEIDNEHGGGICKPLPLDGISGQGVFYSQTTIWCISDQCKIYNTWET